MISGKWQSGLLPHHTSPQACEEAAETVSASLPALGELTVLMANKWTLNQEQATERGESFVAF